MQVNPSTNTLAQPQPHRQPLREVVAQPAPATPGPGSSLAQSTRSTAKKSQKKKVADNWEDDEEVQVAADDRT